jgi:hypothetical protein
MNNWYERTSCLPIMDMSADPESIWNELCITWDEPNGEHNSDMFSRAELARAIETGAFTGCKNIKIELVPNE